MKSTYFCLRRVWILDNLEKTVLAAQVEATVKSIGSNPTPAGIIQAAVTTALITAAFESVKSVLSQPSPKKFAMGGYVSGAGTSTSDSIPAMLSAGESVNTAASTAMFAPLLSYLNVLGGGVPITSPSSSASRLNDGGLSARAAAGGAGLIDYQQLASAIAQQPISVDVRAISTQQGRVARPRILTKLG